MGLLDKFFKQPSWGVHPDDHKRPAADAPLRILPPPAKVYMPLQQHVGGAARPIVLVGQKVLKGQLLAEASGNISAPIHAPVSGTVIESNPALEAQPDAVNNAPYGAGWLFKLKLADAADLNGLLGAAAYRKSAGVP